MPDHTITPAQLAARIFGSNPSDSRSRGARDVRIVARDLYGVQHRPWHFTPEQADAITAKLGR